MIEDKSLKRAITSAAKNGGVRVWIEEGAENVNFWCDEWCVVTDKINMRDHLRGSMGLIVEMLGRLPERPVNIRKGKGEWLEEPMLPEVAAAQIGFFHVAGSLEEVRRLPLTWRLNALWQGKSGQIYGSGYGAPHCGCKTVHVNQNGNIVMLDEDSRECVIAAGFTKSSRDGEDYRELAHLQLLDWDEWVARPAMDQMEMEEEDE